MGNVRLIQWVRVFAKGILGLGDSHCAICNSSEVRHPNNNERANAIHKAPYTTKFERCNFCTSPYSSSRNKHTRRIPRRARAQVLSCRFCKFFVSTFMISTSRWLTFSSNRRSRSKSTSNPRCSSISFITSCCMTKMARCKWELGRLNAKCPTRRTSCNNPTNN